MLYITHWLKKKNLKIDFFIVLHNAAETCQCFAIRIQLKGAPEK